MLTLKYIFAFIICAPVWFLCLWGMGTLMDWVLDRIAPLEESGFFLYILGGVIALAVSIVIPSLFFAIGIAAWELAALLFGIS